MTDRIATDVTYLLSLAAKLEHSPRVRRLAVADKLSAEEVATEAAHSLVDIRRSAEVLADLLPKLLSEEPESEVFDDTLDDIGEELRHIHYHITNTKLFSYVVPAN
jgi:hypothetical protein